MAKKVAPTKKIVRPDASYKRQQSLEIRKNMKELKLVREYADINEEVINKEIVKRLCLLHKIAGKNSKLSRQLTIAIPYDDNPRDNEYHHGWQDETVGEIFRELSQQIARYKIGSYLIIGCKTSIMYNSKTLVVNFNIAKPV